jgi:cob(I)alamin adenosyltransferase
MKIYTRTGDTGTTGFYGGGRAPKNDPRIAAYGTVDELNAFLGMCRATGLPESVDRVVVRLQHDMFALGAELASPGGAAPGSILLSGSDVTAAEADIDRFEAELTPLKTFVLPGGTSGSAAMHAARAVCRSAEREVVALSEVAEIRPEVLAYLNRVGDLLFVLARYVNHAAGTPDVLWIKKDQ